MSTETCGRAVGMTSEWVRKQVAAGRLEAVVWTTGNRKTYRISEEAWRAFRATFSVPAEDLD